MTTLSPNAKPSSAPRRPPALINNIMKLILRSPLHPLLSKQMMLITFTGRKSGKEFTTPVTCWPQANGTVAFFTSNRWWKNLQGGAPVTLHYQGKSVAGMAEPTADPETVAQEAFRFLQQHGVKSQFRIGVNGLDTTRPPTLAEVAAAMQGRAFVRVELKTK